MLKLCAIGVLVGSIFTATQPAYAYTPGNRAITCVSQSRKSAAQTVQFTVSFCAEDSYDGSVKAWTVATSHTCQAGFNFGWACGRYRQGTSGPGFVHTDWFEQQTSYSLCAPVIGCWTPETLTTYIQIFTTADGEQDSKSWITGGGW